MLFINFIKSIEPGDWGTILAAIIAFAASIITINSSKKSAKKSDELNGKIGILQAHTQDKQRIVETIGAQRIIWINDVRKLFVEFNAIVQNLHYIKGNVISRRNVPGDDKIIVDNHFELIKITNSIELLLNPKEIYTKYLLDRMNEIRGKALDYETTIENLNVYLKMMVFAQNVILKAEWKRVKKETDEGRFIAENEINKIFNDVAEGIDYDAHQLVMEKYRNLD